MPKKEIEWGNIPMKGLDDDNLSKYSIKQLIAQENGAISKDIISKKASERWGDDKKRFWAFVEKGNNNDCWISNNKSILLKDGRRISSQRFSLEISGKKSKKECVGHTCNNKMCVNPKHLYYATREEHSSNTPKNGHKGEKNNKAKLTKIEIESIKCEYKSLVKRLNKTYGVATILSKKYNVTSATIGHIVKGKTWK